ncbi:hypothetical protein Pcinc_019442 [Petrolisthes cinctipes]|uniref:Uncharacterized protein n=1 Tax=Petrolisthes cinctipes TaxID=88211 RepID=A0AAE1KMP0_PETCI|nr:hypothetical protein Pcinc_019442 [Petrolisthes cinctipes]
MLVPDTPNPQPPAKKKRRSASAPSWREELCQLRGESPVLPMLINTSDSMKAHTKAASNVTHASASVLAGVDPTPPAEAQVDEPSLTSHQVAPPLLPSKNEDITVNEPPSVALDFLPL